MTKCARKTKLVLILIVVLTMFLFAFPVSAADEAEASPRTLPFDREQIEEIINQTFDKEEIERFFQSADKRYFPDHYWVDEADYVVGYSVSASFLEQVEASDIPANLAVNFEYPEIYIPVYATIKEETRVFGCCRIARGQDGYKAKTTFYNVTDPKFDTDHRHFIETVRSVGKDMGLDPEQNILLLKIGGNSQNQYDGRIALVFAEDGVRVLDFYDSCEVGDEHKLLYDLDEYVTLRAAYLKEDGLGPRFMNWFTQAARTVLIASGVVVGLAAMAIVVVVFIRMKKGTKKKEDEASA